MVLAAGETAMDTSCPDHALPLPGLRQPRYPAAVDSVLHSGFRCLCHFITDGSLIDQGPYRRGLKVNTGACYSEVMNSSNGGSSLSWLVMIITMTLFC